MALSEFLQKTFAHQKSKAHQAGQAVLEYILVLFVTVAIILGLMYQFSEAFKGFTDSYFGNYVACLLETGELPTLGGDSGPNQGTCTPPNFSFSGTMDLGPEAPSGGGESRGGDGRGGGGYRGPGLRPSRLSSGGGVGNGEGAGGSKTRPASISKRTDGAKGGGDSTWSDSSSSGGGRKGNSLRDRRVIYLDDKYSSEKEKDKNPVLAKAKEDDKKAGDKKLRNPAFKLEVPEPKGIPDDRFNKGFTFSTLIKILLISGIIIAIVIFLGGQVLQIKKSWQKSE